MDLVLSNVDPGRHLIKAQVIPEDILGGSDHRPVFTQATVEDGGGDDDGGYGQLRAATEWSRVVAGGHRAITV